jgi:predicted NBD/HSP70 family sugar kinase
MDKMIARCALGLDLGGSSAKLALVTEAGAIVAEDQVPIADARDPEVVLAPVLAAAERLRRTAAERALPLRAVGCGFSGYLDSTRTVVELNNTPALDGFPLARWLRQRLALPVAIDNDACVAALAETRLSDTLGRRRVLFVTVGTGIGVVLVVNGDVARIMKGVTNDAGHIVVNYGSEERCPVGCRGCLETVASARAIAREGAQAARTGASPLLARLLADGDAVTGLDVSRAAERGDRAARDVLVRAGAWLGVGLASWACTYAPDLVLLGGAVAQAGDEWLGSAVAAMRRTGMPLAVDGLVVARATLGNRAGVIGAALLALAEAPRAAGASG